MVAFDKTGTLTEGKPHLVAVEAARGDRSSLLAVSAALQAGSEHPLARAVLRRGRARERASTPRAAKVRAVAGRGVAAQVDGRELRLGSTRLMEELRVDPGALAARAAQLQSAGPHRVVAGRRDRARRALLGLLAFGDTVKRTAAARGGAGCTRRACAPCC